MYITLDVLREPIVLVRLSLWFLQRRWKYLKELNPLSVKMKTRTHTLSLHFLYLEKMQCSLCGKELSPPLPPPTTTNNHQLPPPPVPTASVTTANHQLDIYIHFQNCTTQVAIKWNQVESDAVFGVVALKALSSYSHVNIPGQL
ncbi:hypothetical protein RHMOL_Rhmol03G0153100 [Rhododendron molle]|uniref:Uncharacterized protein n=1 Tax=Rhododendron molle TaxID=49168 RepID=A0ACC0PEH3_RHOML|nr:hypothetical protein RHMOL_Rhmol03G0153100 [Rhododendron molle]